MSLEQAFWQEIAERPEDDVPRLVYADWLEDNGRGARAELIRLQIELARVEGDSSREARRRFKEVRHRERQVFARHRKEWLGALDKSVESYAFRRGFLERVGVSDNQLVAHGGALAEHPALRTVQLDAGWEAVPASCLACPHLVHVTHLSLSSSNQTLNGYVSQLSHFPCLPRLHVLAMHGYGSPPFAVGPLLALDLPALTGLTLWVSGLPLKAVEALGTLAFPKLTHLDLRHNGLDAQRAVALAASPRLRRLQGLDVRGNAIPDSGVALLREHFGAAVQIEPQYGPDEIPF